MIKQALSSWTVRAPIVLGLLVASLSFCSADPLSSVARELQLCNYVGHYKESSTNGLVYFECFGTLASEKSGFPGEGITTSYKTLVVLGKNEMLVVDGRVK